jgi:phosphohistidine phosphatase SixA
MELFLVRHAIAAERDAEQWPDDRDRPLTAAGIVKFRAAAHGLARIVPEVDAVWSSPLRRAWHTAEILKAETGWPAPVECAALEPEHPVEDLMARVRARARGERLALVGHAPGLDELASLALLGSSSGPIFELRKGGAACLCFEAEPVPGAAALLWLVTPKMLRALDW